MSPFSMIFMFFDAFPKSPDRVLTCYLLYFGEVDQMSLVSASGVEPKRCATQNDADSWWFQLGKCIFRSVYGHLRFPTGLGVFPSVSPFVPDLSTLSSVAELIPSTVA